MGAPLSTGEIAELLSGFEVVLSPKALSQLSTYLELLLRWNRRMNLTAIRNPREVVQRLFGESLFLVRVIELRGRLVDIGSGAGFPGLAVKLVAPDLFVTLIESRRKKCAFLKEVVRRCHFSAVEIVPERFEEWAVGRAEADEPDIITTRAVKMRKSLLELMGQRLRPGGKVVVLTTVDLLAGIYEMARGWQWETARPLPGSPRSIFLVARPGATDQ